MTDDQRTHYVTNRVTYGDPCPEPAPVVVNGIPFVNCSLQRGHEGSHELVITWGAM